MVGMLSVVNVVGYTTPYTLSQFVVLLAQTNPNVSVVGDQQLRIAESCVENAERGWALYLVWELGVLDYPIQGQNQACVSLAPGKVRYHQTGKAVEQQTGMVTLG